MDGKRPLSGKLHPVTPFSATFFRAWEGYDDRAPTVAGWRRVWLARSTRFQIPRFFQPSRQRGIMVFGDESRVLHQAHVLALAQVELQQIARVEAQPFIHVTI